MHILDNDDLGFYNAVNEINLMYENERISFTYNKPPEIPTKADIIATFKDLKVVNGLQCNESKEIESNINKIYVPLILTRNNIIHETPYKRCMYLLKRIIPP